MEYPINVSTRKVIVVNGNEFEVGDTVRLQSEYGMVTGYIHFIGTWQKPRNPENRYTDLYPFIHVKYDREGLFRIRECYLWTDEHFKTITKIY